MKFSSVVSYHTNTFGCGVAKFGSELAKRLGVPFVPFGANGGSHPLWSLKWSEIDEDEHQFLQRANAGSFSVFWHDTGNRDFDASAAHIFYADPSLGSPGLWCPSLLTPSKPRTVRLFSFGFAHKLQTAHYAKVRNLLDGAGLDYRLRVSVGLHEGTSLSDATQHFDALKDIMGADKVTILGILSDDAVAEELQNADYVLAFFEKGLRANNTTVHAALSYGKGVITNKDADTPRGLDLSTWDIDGPYLPISPNRLDDYSWDNLIAQMESVCEASKSASV